LEDSVFHIGSAEEFEQSALEMFRYQYENVSVYRHFVNYLGIDSRHVRSIHDIVFLPVELFKNHKIIDENRIEEIIFSSSGTTGSDRSQHYIASLELYEESFSRCFELFYGRPADYCILALLPSYLEREGSSLVYMMDRLIKKSEHEDSGFYLRDYEKLMKKLIRLKSGNKKVILLGVSFAFLELANHFEEDLSGIIFMETGGMKGRGREITRKELHQILQSRFNLSHIHSEYGMTELLSQAYSQSDGKFHTPPWMKILIRDSHDPLQILQTGKSGNINIIDLANRYSCSFLATSDLGRSHFDNSFEVLGRTDNSDIRGCNLLVL
jgi:phenylacetate-coenzyme A ligase PaaK-like adenylate-forming protein